jgi:TPR repeat protein
MNRIRILRAVPAALASAALIILATPAGASPDAAQRLETAHAFLACSSYADALPQLLRAAEAGSAEAQALVGQLYLAGHSVDGGVPGDEARGIGWMRQAAEAGHPDAQRYVTALELRALQTGREVGVADADTRRLSSSCAAPGGGPSMALCASR